MILVGVFDREALVYHKAEYAVDGNADASCLKNAGLFVLEPMKTIIEFLCER